MLVLPITMASVTSRLTRKYQATIPASVRVALALTAGDSIVFEVEKDRVRIRKARPVDLAFAKSLESTLVEWASDEDDQAYDNL
jgi:antitoxin PrlF